MRFNPRARVGRDQRLSRLHLFLGVSIHAPAWGATVVKGMGGKFNGVSIHAPAWGATGFVSLVWIVQRDVSIHAPAWGATMTRSLPEDDSVFQSTRPRGARPHRAHRLMWAFPRCFNPRARVGRDAVRPITDLAVNQFQSTRPRGARPRLSSFCHGHRAVSIHAPAWGATTSGPA